jgi:L-threonylcarbamoyladenylate synthase
VKTPVLRLDKQNPDEASVKKAVAALKNGGLVILPTETVYGIAAEYGNAQALDSLFAVKKREHLLRLPTG